MTTKRFTLFAIVMAAFVLLVGCKKEKEQSIMSPKQQMLKFESFEEIFRYLNGNNRSLSTVFTSYGSYMDSIYYSLNIEHRFKTIEEITKFVNENDSLFQLILCDDGYYMFETYLFDHPFRDVANKNGLFQVNDSIYRIIPDGLISSSLNNIEELKTININTCKSESSNYKLITFKTEQQCERATTFGCGCPSPPFSTPKETEAFNASQDNKIYVKLTFYYNPHQENYNFDIGATFFAKPYKRTVFWFGCFRTIYVEFDANVHYQLSNSTYYRQPCDGVSYVSTSGASTNSTIMKTIYSNVSFPVVASKHIGAVFGRAKTPDTEWATISWRPDHLDDSGIWYPIPGPGPNPNL